MAAPFSRLIKVLDIQLSGVISESRLLILASGNTPEVAIAFAASN